MKDTFTTSGLQMEPYGLKNMNIQNLWTSPIYQIYKHCQILIYWLCLQTLIVYRPRYLPEMEHIFYIYLEKLIR